ncbi:MAG TPA: hypothetical protein VGL89_08210 [Candidatus Koribacter sp.]|jgi:hypothetical protein
MPFKSRLDADRRIAFVEFSGKATYSEIEQYTRQLRGDPNFQPDFAQFINASGVTDTDLNTSELERLATADPFAKDAVRVIIAGSDFVFSVARMFESISDLPRLSVVRTRDEAFRILGLSSDAAD